MARSKAFLYFAVDGCHFEFVFICQGMSSEIRRFIFRCQRVSWGFPLQLEFSGWKIPCSCSCRSRCWCPGRMWWEVSFGSWQVNGVVEVYAVTLLGAQLWKIWIPWVEKAALPEEKRQVRFKILGLSHFLIRIALINCILMDVLGINQAVMEFWLTYS